MVEQIQKQGRRFVRLQRKKQKQSLSRRMVHFLLVLTLGTCIISCSHLRLNLGYECYNDSDAVCASQIKVNYTLHTTTPEPTYTPKQVRFSGNGNFDDLLKARHACLKELGGGTPNCGIFRGCLQTKGYTRDDISGKITVPGQFVVSCN